MAKKVKKSQAQKVAEILNPLVENIIKCRKNVTKFKKLEQQGIILFRKGISTLTLEQQELFKEKINKLEEKLKLHRS